MIPDYLAKSPIPYIDDISGVDTSSTDLAIFGYAKKIERISDFKNLKRVWLNSVNQKQFDVIANAINPIVLKVYNMRVPDICALNQYSRLRELSLEWNTKTESIDSVSGLKTLKVLQIQDFTKVRDLGPISELRNLETLDISGGIWNVFKVETLEPIRTLSNLKYLCLTNIRVLDESLDAVSSLERLQELIISNQFPTEEYAKLSVLLPKTSCNFFAPWVELKNDIGGNDIMVVGKRKPFLNKVKDSKRLKKYNQEFENFRNKYRVQQGNGGYAKH